MEVNYKEIDELYNKYTEMIDYELTKKNLDVEQLQFYSGARNALLNLKKYHESRSLVGDPLKYEAVKKYETNS